MRARRRRQLRIIEGFGDGGLACRELAGIDLRGHGGNGCGFSYALGRDRVAENQQNERSSGLACALPTPLDHAAKHQKED